jgi:hypothetical protein
MLRAFAIAALFLAIAGLATATPAEARPDLCDDYGLCVFVCADGISQDCPGAACVGFSTQIPVCLPRLN